MILGEFFNYIIHMVWFEGEKQIAISVNHMRIMQSQIRERRINKYAKPVKKNTVMLIFPLIDVPVYHQQEKTYRDMQRYKDSWFLFQCVKRP